MVPAVVIGAVIVAVLFILATIPVLARVLFRIYFEERMRSLEGLINRQEEKELDNGNK